MPDRCPDIAALIAFSGPDLPEPSRRPLEAHVNDCPACRHALGALAADPRPAGDPPSPGELRRAMERFDSADRAVSRRRHWRAGWAAAAGLLLASGAIGAWIQLRTNRSGIESDTSPIPSGRPIEGRFERLAAGDLVQLPDGTRLRFGDRAQARFLPPASGERRHLRLESGEVEVLAGKGAGAFRVSTGAGVVEVLGTHFTVQTSRPGAGAPLEEFRLDEVTRVEVREGKVKLSNAGGELVLAAGMQGLSLPGAVPFQQDAAGSWEAGLEQFAGLLIPAADRPRLRADKKTAAAVLASTFWRQRRDSSASVLLDETRNRPAPQRVAAAYLIVLSAPPDAAQALRRMSQDDPDASVRAAALKALSCAEGERE